MQYHAWNDTDAVEALKVELCSRGFSEETNGSVGGGVSVALYKNAEHTVSVGLLLSGCGADTVTPETRADSFAAAETSSTSPDTRSATSDAAPATAASASATIGGREFTFELDGCLVYDGRETEIDGPGRETGSTTPSYLDGGSTQMRAPALGEFSIVPDGDGYLVSGRAWDSNGTDLGPGTVYFTCG